MGENNQQCERKHKRQYFSRTHGGERNNKRAKYNLRQHGRGILITCGSPNYAREGLREAFNILHEELDKKNNENTAKESQDVKNTSTVEELVSKELNELKNEHDRLVAVHDLSKGLNFIQFTRQDDNPNDIVYSMLREKMDARDADNKAAGKSKFRGCRFLNRIIPIDIACSPHFSSVTKTLKELITAYFPKSRIALSPEEFDNDDISNGSSDEEDQNKKKAENKDFEQENNDAQAALSGSKTSETSSTIFVPSFTVLEGSTWAVEFQRRGGMKTLDRTKLIDLIGSYVGTNYKVNLTQPSYTLLLEISPACCGISILRCYAEFFNYNIHRILHGATGVLPKAGVNTDDSKILCNNEKDTTEESNK